MVGNQRSPINDHPQSLSWELAAIRLADPRQVGWLGLEKFRVRPITTPVIAMAGQTRDFVLNDPEMKEVLVALSLGPVGAKASAGNDKRGQANDCGCKADGCLGLRLKIETRHRHQA